MIQAILRNKIKSEVRDYFKTKEDTLTSSVIGNLLFLPTNFILEILSNSSYDKFSYSRFGKLSSFEFWPHWNSKNTSNSNFVEPDVFLRFENVDLIIEAKRYDDNQQYIGQWKNEIISYYNEYEDEEKELYFLAIGGINSNNTELIPIVGKSDVLIYKLRWKKILDEVTKNIEKLEKIKSFSDNANSTIRILQVILQSFELHGFLSIKWFKDFKKHFFINNTKMINHWVPNKKYLFNLKVENQIEHKGIELWKI